MRALTRRIERMGVKLAASIERDQRSTDRILQALVADRVAANPLLREVVPQDTDPETYRKIRSMIALADGEFEVARRLRPPPGPPRTFSEALDDVLNWDHAKYDEECRRERRALAAARRRLNKGGKGRARAPVPRTGPRTGPPTSPPSVPPPIPPAIPESEEGWL